MQEPQGAAPEPAWERKVLETLARDVLKEQRARRRWGIFFKLVGLAYGLILLMLIGAAFVMREPIAAGPHTAMVRLEGVIAANEAASAERVNQALQRAFAAPSVRGVILRINSPGGSPVQSGLIYDEIRRLRKQYPKVPLYAVVEDVCASGGYYVASAADRIYVDRASLVGSIGVLMDGFGFTGTLEKLGVERRLLTAGENKGFLDPFSPLSDKQRAFAQQMLDQIHAQFIAAVKAGRGKRLKETPELFSGLVWNGEASIQLGLADGLGSVGSVSRDVIGADDVVDYTVKESVTERLSKQFGASLAQGMSGVANEVRLR